MVIHKRRFFGDFIVAWLLFGFVSTLQLWIKIIIIIYTDLSSFKGDWSFVSMLWHALDVLEEFTSSRASSRDSHIYVFLFIILAVYGSLDQEKIKWLVVDGEITWRYVPCRWKDGDEGLLNILFSILRLPHLLSILLCKKEVISEAGLNKQQQPAN